MCFIRKFIQYKRKIDKQSVCFMALYASLAVQKSFSVVWWMTISSFCKHWFTKYLHIVIFFWIFCLKISDKYQISISDINQVIDITTTLNCRFKVCNTCCDLVHCVIGIVVLCLCTRSVHLIAASCC